MRERVYSRGLRRMALSLSLSPMKTPAEAGTRREEDSVQVFLRLLLPLLPEVRTILAEADAAVISDIWQYLDCTQSVKYGRPVCGQPDSPS